jgi:hypothetical protein
MIKIQIMIVAAVAVVSAANLSFRAMGEYGFVNVISHKVKLGKQGTDFDYVKDGGQDLLFPVGRYSVEMDVGKKNTFILLYQPLRIETQYYLQDSVMFNGIVYPDSTGLNAVYSFPFYRASYLREMLPENPNTKLAIGLTLQIRNALISFESTDGSRFTSNGGIGIVPALKVRCKKIFAERFFAELEADGIYAPVSYLNGSDNEIVGAILDASIRAGAKVKNSSSVFVNLRYLGGGATGTSTRDVWPGDGYVKNWLHFFTFTIGVIMEL